jgi:hypothetical protein
MDLFSMLLEKVINPSDNTGLVAIETLIDNSGVLEDTGDSVSEKVKELIEKARYYDVFWDGLQQYGERNYYEYAFINDFYTNNSFYPKYDIKGDLKYCFRHATNLTIDLCERLKECNVTFDTSKTAMFNYMFEACGLTALPTINTLKASGGFVYTFTCPNLVTIEKIISKRDNDYSTAFINARLLKNITFEGEIGKNISFIHSSLLSAESIQSIIDGLVTVETAQTLTLHSDVTAKLTTEQFNTISSKNWELI